MNHDKRKQRDDGRHDGVIMPVPAEARNAYLQYAQEGLGDRS